uniref:FAD dependent oxidoreductase domain-containing protein n=2 Tax=Plectus sambesii TaxID=2011161 RepID=A0A914XME7_9BILA
MHQGRLTTAVRRWSTPFVIRSSSAQCHYSTTGESSSSSSSPSVPKQVEVVVCGGGITGLSVAYHLAKRGCSVALFERSIGCGGATGASAGLLSASMLWQDNSVQKMAQASIKLYKELSTGDRFRFNRCGRVYLAHSDSTAVSVRRMYAKARSLGQEAELIDDNTEMLAKWPSISTEDIQLALFIADDAVVDPIGLCRELSKRAAQEGAAIIEQCAVKEVLIGDQTKV